MKKYVALILVLLSCTAVMTGCGNSAPKDVSVVSMDGSSDDIVPDIPESTPVPATEKPAETVLENAQGSPAPEVPQETAPAEETVTLTLPVSIEGEIRAKSYFEENLLSEHPDELVKDTQGNIKLDLFESEYEAQCEKAEAALDEMRSELCATYEEIEDLIPSNDWYRVTVIVKGGTDLEALRTGEPGAKLCDMAYIHHVLAQNIDYESECQFIFLNSGHEVLDILDVKLLLK